MPKDLKTKSIQDVAQDLNRLVNDDIHRLESPIERAMALVGDKYSILIIDVLYRLEKCRFMELENQVRGISPRTLSARLKQLERTGLISREQFPTIPPKVEYALTEKGDDLVQTLEALTQWADKWYPYEAKTKTSETF